MKISFVETDSSARDFFAEHLTRHELRFFTSADEVPADTEIVSVFIHSRMDEPFLDAHPHLRLIATRSTGFDHIDLDACRARGVAVCLVPSYGDSTVAEHTFALMLALSRRLSEAACAKAKRHFSYAELRGIELRGKTLGVIGAGRIGLHTLSIARAFRMETIARDIAPQRFLQDIIGFRYVALDELLERSHIISLHLPLTAESFHLLNRETLAKCRRGVLIVNTARGALIDTEALIEALDNGTVGGVGVDVLKDESVMQKEMPCIVADQIIQRLQTSFPPQELRMQDQKRIKELQALHQNAALLSRPNVVFTPHIAFNSVEAIERINTTTIGNIEAFAAGKPENLISVRAARAPEVRLQA